MIYLYKCIEGFHVGYSYYGKGSWWEKVDKHKLRNIKTKEIVSLSDLAVSTRFERYKKS